MFAKIFAQIFDSTIAEDYVTRHVFMDLLVLCDREGAVDMTIPAISRRTNVPEDVITAAIAKLSKPDGGSRSDEEEGRRLIPIDSHRNWGWLVVNYQHYRTLIDEETRRTYFRDKQRERRSKVSKTVKDTPDLSNLSNLSKKVTQGEASVIGITDVSNLSAEDVIARIRAIGKWKDWKSITAEHALIDCLVEGADPVEIVNNLARIWVWTENGKFAPKLAEVIRRWDEPETSWKWEEKSNGKLRRSKGYISPEQGDQILQSGMDEAD